jgi:hypothetical protein
VTARFRYLDTLTIGFVVILVVSNLVGPKICQIGPLPYIGPLLVSGAQLLFPVTYICGDIFTEVYGYAASPWASCLSWGRSQSRFPRRRPEVYASARFMLLMASSTSCVLLNPIVAQSTPAFWKANLIAFTRSSWLFWN